MVEVSINEQTHKIEKGLTIIQACENVGIQIPRFCYHEYLSIAGNCRMCLVEVDKSVKPVASCALLCENGIKIFTNTLLVKKAREGVMEFLLINHPLDCPICDQGGECDLQDQAMLFGNDRGRFYETKRVVSDIDIGPYIKTVMTRCIHCTRCIRFLTEIGGSFSMGTTGRGVKTEVGVYVAQYIDSEVSGNIIDLCPVGALTSKPYAFTARSWELIKVESIDTLDSMGSNIAYHIAGGKIMRILPVIHLGINEEWISNSTRFSYDGFIMQRLIFCLLKSGGELQKTLRAPIAKMLLMRVQDLMAIYLNDDLSLETLYSLKVLQNLLKNTKVIIKNKFYIRNIDFRQNYLLNSTYSSIKQSDYCFILGCNLKTEIPLLLMRLRKEKWQRYVRIIIFGGSIPYKLEEEQLGLNLNNLVWFIEGKHGECALFAKAKKPLVFIGNSLVLTNKIMNIFLLVKYAVKTCSLRWEAINFLDVGSGIIGNYEIGFNMSYVMKKATTLLNIGDLDTKIKTENNFAIFLGSYGMDSLSLYNVCWPVQSNVEQVGLFMNNEGRCQTAKRVIIGPKNARTQWEYFVSFFDLILLNGNPCAIQKDIHLYLQKLYRINLNTVGYETFLVTSVFKQEIWLQPIGFSVLEEKVQNTVLRNSKHMRYKEITW